MQFNYPAHQWNMCSKLTKNEARELSHETRGVTFNIKKWVKNKKKQYASKWFLETRYEYIVESYENNHYRDAILGALDRTADIQCICCRKTPTITYSYNGYWNQKQPRAKRKNGRKVNKFRQDALIEKESAMDGFHLKSKSIICNDCHKIITKTIGKDRSFATREIYNNFYLIEIIKLTKEMKGNKWSMNIDYSTSHSSDI